MKRVLLTGASGFVGSHVLRHIMVTTDWEVVSLCSFRHMGKSDRITQQMEGQDWNRLTVLMHDLRAPISDQLAHDIGKVDYVLNVASESHVDRSIEQPREFIENNVALVLTVLDYVRRYPAKMLHVSTDEVYGPAIDHNHKEGEPHRPSNPYSASKSAQESIIYAYRRTYGLEVAISNTMNIIGEMQDPEKFMPMVMQKVAAGEPMTIHASAEGVIGSRYYLHARNQADALLFLLKNVDFAKYIPGEADMPRFNVVGESEVNNLEMAQMIAAAMGKELKFELVDFHSSRPGHDLRYALEGVKMAELGWKAPYSLEQSIQRTVSWTMENPKWLR